MAWALQGVGRFEKQGHGSGLIIVVMNRQCAFFCYGFWAIAFAKCHGLRRTHNGLGLFHVQFWIIHECAILRGGYEEPEKTGHGHGYKQVQDNGKYYLGYLRTSEQPVGCSKKTVRETVKQRGEDCFKGR